MKTYLKNLNACSTFSLLLFGGIAFSAPNTSFSEKQIIAQIKEDLKNIPQQGAFSSIIDRWSHLYGTQALTPLYKLTLDKSTSENIRYITLMAMVKSGGLSTVPQVNSLLLDPSWNIKVGSLKALRMIASAHPKERFILSQEQLDIYRALLKDKALVVRNETVMTIEALGIKELIPDLLLALNEPRNFHHGKPIWVPQKILRSLTTLDAPSSASKKLLPLLETVKDTEFTKLTLTTLENISNKKPKIKDNATLALRVEAWKKHLTQVE